MYLLADTNVCDFASIKTSYGSQEHGKWHESVLWFFYSYNNEPGQVWSLAHTLLLKSNSVSNGHKIRGKLQEQD